MSDPIFQNGLQDLVRGIRSNKRDPKTFISQQIVEIKNELKSTDTYIKAEAVNNNDDTMTNKMIVLYNSTSLLICFLVCTYIGS